MCIYVYGVKSIRSTLQFLLNWEWVRFCQEWVIFFSNTFLHLKKQLKTFLLSSSNMVNYINRYPISDLRIRIVSKGWKEIAHGSGNQKKVGVAILISDFKQKQ